jgi:DNA-binding beta-propeller fold protein YncE
LTFNVYVLGIIAMLSRIGNKTNLNRKTSKTTTVLMVLTFVILVGSFFGVAGNLTKAAYAQETHNFVRGIVAKSLSTSATGSGAFNNLTGIAVEPLSRFVYLVDNGSNSILLFSVDGKFLTKWGSSGSGDGQFKSPCGIAVDSIENNVYVQDNGNNRVQVFNSNGKFLTKWSLPGS